MKMKKLIAAALVANLSVAASASGIEGLRASGFAPITMEQIKARPVAGNKGVSIVINNTNINNGSSSVHNNVNVNGADLGTPGDNGVSVAINNNSFHNNASHVHNNVNVHNAGVNSPGKDDIGVEINNNSTHNGTSGVETNVNVHNSDDNSAGDDNISVAVNNNNTSNGGASANTAVNINNTDDGAYSEGNIGVNIGNHNNGNANVVSNTDVTVNGVNANAGKEAVYESPVLYRYESQAQAAMEKVLGKLGNVKGVQVLSKKITECGYRFNFEIRFLSKRPLRAYTPQKLYTYPVQAENLMYNKVLELQDSSWQVISAELIEAGAKYTYVIAYFPAK